MDIPQLTQQDIPPVLQRGSACLTCRKRKLKCDAARPTCSQCNRSFRECVYDESPPRTRAQKLQDRIDELEDQLRASQSMYATVGAVAMANSSTATSQTSQHSSGSSRSQSISPPSGGLAVPGTSPPQRPEDWLLHDTLPLEIQQYLLNVFMANRRKVYFEIYPERFLASFSASAPYQLHPAMMNAVWLIACHLSDSASLIAREEMFLNKARQAIYNSLATSDRLFHCIQASMLLSAYLYRKGRVLEAYHQTSFTAQFSVACGLHQITAAQVNDAQSQVNPRVLLATTPWNSRVTASGNLSPGVLEPPQDAIGLGERIYTWWSVYLLDKIGSMTIGLPSALPDENDPIHAPTTSWPRRLEEYARLTLAEALNGSIQELYGATPPPSNFPETTFTLRLKVQALLERAHRMSLAFDTQHHLTERFRSNFASVDVALVRFLNALPPVRQAGPDASVNHGIFISSTLAHGAVVVLHSNYADTDSASYEKCSSSARAAMQLLDAVGTGGSSAFSDMMLGHCWTVLAQFLARKLSWYKRSNRAEQAAEAESHIAKILASMTQLADAFPFLSFQLKKIQDIQLSASLA